MRTRYTARYTTRSTAVLTAATLALGSLSVPQALAAPDTSVRESAHGQWLCTVEPSAEDRAAADAVREGYIATIRATAEEIQAQVPGVDFSGFTSPNVTQLPGYATAAAALRAKGYNASDILLIAVGANNPEALVASSETLLQARAEYSINGSRTQMDAFTAKGGQPRVPLLSTGRDFSDAMKKVLKKHQAQEAEAVEAFNATAGYPAQAQAWEQCIALLKEKGAVEGYQPVPEIDIPGKTQSPLDSSSTGVLVVGGMFALAALLVGGYMAVNGVSFGGFELPVLQLPQLQLPQLQLPGF
ncbi:serine/threonine protein kinase [Corynebacterium sp.]|uniref:serine/threonine protein kinase n=1 Tax=Corynebacterium sp. TaxID=1720 RepID=UPI0026DDADDE|nr:serine/threonine protein kinase [Corynebacterium sp.]MDO5032421.1 serine/threonine protein kinase [Corynebacterium sp.]